MEYFERKINVFKPNYIEPLYVVQGSNMLTIKITFADWDIPSGAIVKWQVITSTKGELNNATYEDNTVSIVPYNTTFSEAGKGYLQLRVEKDEKVLVSFAIDVLIFRDRLMSPVEGSNSDVVKVLVDQYVEEATGTLFEDLEAQAQSELASIRATGEEVKASIPSTYTALENRVGVLEQKSGKGVGVPSTVREAIFTLLNSAVYTATGLTDEIALVEAWANTTCTAIILSKTSLTFSDGTPKTLTYTLDPVDCEDVPTWSSSDDLIATVSNGIITPLKNGSCTIYATIGTVMASCSVSISGIIVRYPVTNNLTNCTTSNNSPTAIDGEAYTATITANTASTLTSVTVIMNGVDITSSAYSNGVINIQSVTGPIVITAEAESALLYTLPSPTTFDGTNVIDTGVYLFKKDEDFTITLHITFERAINWNKIICGVRESSTNSICIKVRNSINVSWLGASGQTAGDGNDGTNNEEKFVITHVAGSEALIVNGWSIKDGTRKSDTSNLQVLSTRGWADIDATKWFGDYPVVLGGYNVDSPSITNATVHDFAIMKGVMSAADIAEYLEAE